MCGDRGVFGLWLDGDLYHGRTQWCMTYDNDLLTASEDFMIKCLEVWTFTWMQRAAGNYVCLCLPYTNGIIFTPVLQCVQEKVIPCIHFHNSGKQCRLFSANSINSCNIYSKFSEVTWKHEVSTIGYLTGMWLSKCRNQTYPSSLTLSTT